VYHRRPSTGAMHVFFIRATSKEIYSDILSATHFAVCG